MLQNEPKNEAKLVASPCQLRDFTNRAKVEFLPFAPGCRGATGIADGAGCSGTGACFSSALTEGGVLGLLIGEAGRSACGWG